MKFYIETGNESHTSSWQKCQAKFVGGEKDGQFLYTDKSSIISTEWPKNLNDKHQTVVQTVYELPEGTDILIDYNGWNGPEKFIIHLDSTQEVVTYEIGTSRLRTYTMKGRYTVVCDLVEEDKKRKRAAKEEGF